MLIELSIRNLAVIESIHMECRRGFHVFTGETGAGKSIIIDALSLIAGGRGSAELVRHGCDKAEIECTFEIHKDHPVWSALAELGIEGSGDELLVIRREMSAQGKSTGRINGQLVNLTMLREIGGWLVNIHGQHEHQSLLKADEHLQWLDIYGEEQIKPVKAKYESIFRKYKKLKQEITNLENTGKQNLQMLDLYRFQIEEMETVDLKVGEDELLLEEKQKLANAEKMFHSTAESYELLYGNQHGLDAIAKAMHGLEDIVSYDPSVLQPLLEQIQSAYYQLEDAAHELRDYKEQIEFNPERLDEIETRLDMISKLRRKYGDQITDILQYLQKIKQETEDIEHKDERIEALQKEAAEEHALLTQAAEQLTIRRREAAKSLAEQIVHELRDLHMERTLFEVKMESLNKFTEEGIDGIEFMISANPGEPLKSLSKIASGGELSRIMLAMKTIFAGIDQIPVLVFDEVDTGVSGRAAQAIAEKMSKLSGECQVFSITHLPQVACMSDIHYAIQKKVAEERTFTQINTLNEQERIRELARMLGGVEVTETTEHHAKEMLDMAKQKKELWNHLQ
jgi:DNA repair protein RecN (Recombination protein N)